MRKAGTKLLLFTLAAVAAAVLPWHPGHAGKQGNQQETVLYVPSTLEELEGTWVNENASYGQEYRKMVYTWWGYFELYRHLNDARPAGRGTSTVVDKWKDGEGATWYREYCRGDWGSRTVYYRLIKLSDQADRWESVQSTVGFPSPEDFAEDSRAERGYQLFRRHTLEACCH
jgi:hypothetical protein